MDIYVHQTKGPSALTIDGLGMDPGLPVPLLL